MNLRTTVILFALFLTMLWVFGFMLTVKQPLAEEGYLFPSLRNDTALAAQSLSFERNLKKAKDSFSFIKEKDGWRLVVGSEATLIETARIKPLLERIRNAKHNPDSSLSDDLASLGLDPPLRSVTLKGRPEGKDGLSGKEQSWTLHLGNESADKMVVYAQSSERPGKVFALTKRDVELLLFDDPVSLHSQMFFTFPIEEGGVQKIIVKDRKNTLELSHIEARLWRFDKPALGYADYDPTEVLKGFKPKEAGVKGLIYAIRSLRVAEEGDFLPLGKDSLASYGLEEGKEWMRIEVVPRDARTKKDLPRETLLVGKPVTDKWLEVYVRLAGDPAVAKLARKHLFFIDRVLADPALIRSRDLAFFQPEQVARVEFTRGKERFDLTRTEDGPWQLSVNGGPLRLAEARATDNLLQTLRGNQAVESFDPLAEKAKDAFDKPQLEIRIVETPPAKAGEGKDRITTLVFGPQLGDVVAVQRTLPDGQVSQLQVLTSIIEKITGADPELTYLDRALPRIAPSSVARVSLQREGVPVELVRDAESRSERWLLRDERESLGFVPADSKSVQSLLDRLARPPVTQWVKRITRKDDLATYGLDKPSLAITLGLHDLFAPATVGAMAGAGLSFHDLPWHLPATGLQLAQHGPVHSITLRIGKDNGKEGEDRGVYALRSDLDLLFLLPPALLKELASEEYRDRRSMFTLQPLIDLGLLSQATARDVHFLLLASPIATGRMHAFDPRQVKELKYSLRTPYELRQFTFAQFDKDGWKEQAGLLEFQLDPEKMKLFLKQLAELHAERILSLTGPQAEQKLSPKDAWLRAEATLKDGTTLTLTVGAGDEKMGYYAQTSAQPNLVFLLPADPVSRWFLGPALFARERVAAGP